jgi:hypothetical protein
LVAWGEVRGVQHWYEFKSVFVTEKHLTFSTATVGGVSYDFDGTFLGKGDLAGQFLGNGIVMFILVVVAHPDDELAIFSYLARAVLDEGKRVAVVLYNSRRQRRQ